jgi:uncharacterized membrane protein
MIRWLLLIVAGVLLGGIVHLATIIVLPHTATQDAYSRLTPVSPPNSVVALPAPTPEKAVLPFMDPAFASAVCRYDLTQAPLKISVPVTIAYTSISFYTDYDIAYYAINDRSAGGHGIELDLMTAEQHDAMPENENLTAADLLIVESPTLTGLIVVHALAPQPGSMPKVKSALDQAQCKPIAEPQSSQ